MYIAWRFFKVDSHSYFFSSPYNMAEDILGLYYMFDPEELAVNLKAKVNLWQIEAVVDVT